MDSFAIFITFSERNPDLDIRRYPEILLAMKSRRNPNIWGKWRA